MDDAKKRGNLINAVNTKNNLSDVICGAKTSLLFNNIAVKPGIDGPPCREPSPWEGGGGVPRPSKPCEIP